MPIDVAMTLLLTALPVDACRVGKFYDDMAMQRDWHVPNTPRSWEAVRFPSAEAADVQLAVIQGWGEVVEDYHRRYPGRNDAYWGMQWECQWRRRAWELVRCVQTTESAARRRYLKLLRDHIGPDDFHLGVMPEALPRRWLAER